VKDPIAVEEIRKLFEEQYKHPTGLGLKMDPEGELCWFLLVGAPTRKDFPEEFYGLKVEITPHFKNVARRKDQL